PWADQLAALPVVMFGLCAGLGFALTFNPRPRPYRWYRAIFGLMAICAAATLIHPDPFVGQAPDYLLLCFFAVTLYYNEKLVFFDLLIKRGAFFAVGLVSLTLFFGLAPLNAN